MKTLLLALLVLSSVSSKADASITAKMLSEYAAIVTSPELIQTLEKEEIYSIDSISYFDNVPSSRTFLYEVTGKRMNKENPFGQTCRIFVEVRSEKQNSLNISLVDCK